MSEAAAEQHGASKEHEKPRLEGVVWFTFMVGMWSAFSTLLLASPETLDDIWDWLTDLPLALEILMWIAILPWALALAVWEADWSDWLTYLVIALLGLGWTLVSKPRVKRR
jgi:hypothetical protein